MFSTLYNLISRYNRSALTFSNMYFVDLVNLPVVEDSIVSRQGLGALSLSDSLLVPGDRSFAAAVSAADGN